MKRVRMWLVLLNMTIFVVAMQAQNVVTDWNTIAANTITQEGKISDAFLYFAYTSIAVYDATNSIHRSFRPFYFYGATDRDASDEAAAVSAAHAVLVNYFPDQKAALDAQFVQSLKTIGAPSWAKRKGIEAGVAAAQTLIAERMGDGRKQTSPTTGKRGPAIGNQRRPVICLQRFPGCNSCARSR